MARGTIYTIGHSTTEFSQFAKLLCDAGVEELLDVRRVPHSRRNPQFDSGAIAYPPRQGELAVGV